MHTRATFLRLLVLTLLCCAALRPAAAQTTPPPGPAATDIGNGCVIDLPGGWKAAAGLAVDQAFLQRSGVLLLAAYHPEGSRPTDLPYALVEHFAASKNVTNAEQDQIAEIVRSYYTTAVRPPSKADRSAGWKRATVTPVVHDYRNRRFSFRATIQYDVGGTHHVEVACAFGNESAGVVSVWSDDAARAAHGPAITSLTDSVRRGGPAPRASVKESFITFARVAGVLLILLVVGVQVFVLVRERRQRRAEELALDRMVP